MGAALHINRGVNVRYCARVRRHGYRKWEPVTSWIKSDTRAIKAAAAAFCDHRFKRGQVLMIADWYDPIVVCEMSR